MDNLKEESHNIAKFQKMIIKYHDSNACQPDTKDAKKHLDKILDILTKNLKKQNLCKELLKSGSTYENLKIGRQSHGNDDLEFDIMIIVGTNLVFSTDRCSHPKLRPTKNFPSILQSCISEKKLLDPKIVISKFHGIIDSIFFKSRFALLDYVLKLRAHGTAIQLDVKKKLDDSNLFFSIDLVPTFKILRDLKEEYYIPKPFEDGILNWRRSFSIEEKNIFKHIDPINGCCKKLLRVIKHLFSKETPLNSLSSYQLKTVMMNLIEINAGKQDIWTEDKMFNRFIDYMKLFHSYLLSQSVPHRFTNENILNLKPITIKDLEGRIGELLRSEAKMENLFTFK